MITLPIVGLFLGLVGLLLSVFVNRWRRRLTITRALARKITAWSFLASSAAILFSAFTFMSGSFGSVPILVVSVVLVVGLLGVISARAWRELRPIPTTWRGQIAEQHVMRVNTVLLFVGGTAVAGHWMLLAAFSADRRDGVFGSVLSTPLPAIVLPLAIWLVALIPLSQYATVNRLRAAAEARPQLSDEQIDELHRDGIDHLRRRRRPYLAMMYVLCFGLGVFFVVFFMLVMNLLIWDNPAAAGIWLLVAATLGTFGLLAIWGIPVLSEINESKLEARLSLREQLIGRRRERERMGRHVRFSDALTDPDRALRVVQIPSPYAGTFGEAAAGEIAATSELTLVGDPFPGEAPALVEGPLEYDDEDDDDESYDSMAAVEERVYEFFLLRTAISRRGSSQKATRAFIDTIRANAGGDRFDVFCDYSTLTLVKVGETDYEPVPDELAHRVLDAVNAAAQA